jgi:sulfite reductase alpha subunit-like flavoprotein
MQSSQAWLDKGVEYKCSLRTYASEAEAKRQPAIQTTSCIDAAKVIAFRVTCNRELCTGGDRSCRHVELDILDQQSSYETGDHVAIFPDNEQVSLCPSLLLSLPPSLPPPLPPSLHSSLPPSSPPLARSLARSAPVCTPAHPAHKL